MAWMCEPATELLLQCENPGLVSVLGFLMTTPRPPSIKSVSCDSVSEKEQGSTASSSSPPPAPE